MSTQDTAALVESVNKMTDTVAGKMGEIDALLSESAAKIEKGEVNQIGISMKKLFSIGASSPLVVNKSSFEGVREFQVSFYCAGQGDSDGFGGAGADVWLDAIEFYPEYGGFTARLDFMMYQRGVANFIDESCVMRASKRVEEQPTFLQNRDGVTDLVNFRLLDVERNVVELGSGAARYLQIRVKRYNNVWLKALFINTI